MRLLLERLSTVWSRFCSERRLEVKQLIQVTYESGKDEIDKREIKALLKASELLNCNNLLIITWDYEDEMRIDNKMIKYVPLWKWLLDVKLNINKGKSR